MVPPCEILGIINLRHLVALRDHVLAFGPGEVRNVAHDHIGITLHDPRAKAESEPGVRFHNKGELNSIVVGVDRPLEVILSRYL